MANNISVGQHVNRFANETAIDFVERLKPDSCKIAHSVIETNTWNLGGKIVIVFYFKSINYSYEASSGDTLAGQKAFGYVFIESNLGVYKKVLIDTFDIDTKIESVFFANADDDKDKELCVLTSNIPPPIYCKCAGVYYATKIYDKPNSNSTRLQHMWKISSKFMEFEGLARGNIEEQKATFKTAQAVKKQLSQLGYSQ